MKKPRDPDLWDEPDQPEAPFELSVTLDCPGGSILLEWIRAESNIPETEMRITLSGPDELSWDWASGQLAWRCRVLANAVRGNLGRLRNMFPCGGSVFAGYIPLPNPGTATKPDSWTPLDLPPDLSPWPWLEREVLHMASELRVTFSTLAKLAKEIEESDGGRSFRRSARKLEKEQREAAERAARIAEASRRQMAERRRKEAERRQRAAREALFSRALDYRDIPPTNHRCTPSSAESYPFRCQVFP